MDNIHIQNAIMEIWNIVARTNKYIDETAPWVLAKNEETEKLQSVMYHLVENLRKVAILIKPFMNETSIKIFKQLGINVKELLTWESLYQYNTLPEGVKVIEKGEPLFIRLDMNEEVEYIKEGMKRKL